MNYNYYANRDVQSITDANGRTISYVWNTNGLPATMTDSVTGDITSFAYDGKFRPYTVSINGVVVLTTSYDVSGRGSILASLGADGRQFIYQYDDLNRLTREVRADDSFTAYDWACCFIESTRFGKMENNVEKTLRRSITYHDKRALPLFTIDTNGRTTRYEHDISGRFVKLTDPKEQITQWSYNAADQLKEKIYPDLTSESFTYDAFGRVKNFTNRRSQKTWMYYESLDGQIQSINRPSPDPDLTYSYDTWRRVEEIEQTTGTGSSPGIYTFDHDSIGRITSIDGPWSDDAISYFYNDASRSVTRTSPGGMTETTTGDAFGRVASIANILGTFTNGYDDTVTGGITTSISTLLKSITHTGANAGFNTAFTYHGDAFDRALATITSTKPGGSIIAKHSYGYNSLGNINTWKREALLANPSGPTRQFESSVYYDTADQVSSLIHVPLPGSSVIDSTHHYSYDLAGNIASKQVESTSTGATMTAYSHNSLNQLTGIGGSAGASTVIVRGDTDEPATVRVRPDNTAPWQDARMLSGNRFESDLDLATGPNSFQIEAEDGSSNVSTYTYDLTLTAASASTPTHDADGNMTSDGVRSYEWDSQSRLIKITWGAGSNKTTEFKYNALGQRAECIDKTGSTETAHHYYLYEGIRFLCRYTGGTAVTNIDRRYLSQGEQRYNGSDWDSYYYTRDHLGSVREVVKSDGNLAARYDYDPYGKRSAQYLDTTYSDGCDLGYTGHITQPNPVSGHGELVMTLFRVYDPELGRWLSADPLERITGETAELLPEGPNLYGYVENDPLNFWDPNGFGKVGMVFKIVNFLEKKTYKILGKTDLNGAVDALKCGDDIIAANRKAATDLGKRASAKGKQPVHEIDAKTGQPHIHPTPRTGGHVLYSGTFIGVFGSNWFTEGLDFVNPIRDVADIIQAADAEAAEKEHYNSKASKLNAFCPQG